MKEVKTVWHWWWGWNIEKVENWLEEMEKNGWNLIKVDFTKMRFKFKKGKVGKFDTVWIIKCMLKIIILSFSKKMVGN